MVEKNSSKSQVLSCLSCCLFVVLFSLILSGCVINSSSHSSELVSIVEPSSGLTLSSAEFTRRLIESDYILLGEQHDQASHHYQRSLLLQSLSEYGSLLVSMEHLEPEQAELLQRSSIDLQTLPTLLEWQQSGWPNWEIFKPLFGVLVRIRPILVSAKRQAELAPYGVNKPLPEIDTLRAVLTGAHPKLSDSNLIEKMVGVQRQWDASMAASLDAFPAKYRVLLAGNGHVRKDFGVAWYLKYRHPRAVVTSVGYSSDGVLLRSESCNQYDLIVDISKLRNLN